MHQTSKTYLRTRRSWWTLQVKVTIFPFSMTKTLFNCSNPLINYILHLLVVHLYQTLPALLDLLYLLYVPMESKWILV